MADVVNAATRSRMMSDMPTKNTKPERRLRDALQELGFSLETHAGDLPGCPDIVDRNRRCVIQVHGCFWHRHPGCRYAATPVTRPDFWIPKLTRNAERDARNMQRSRELGWRTAVVWECQLRMPEQVRATSALVGEWIRSEDASFELPVGGADVSSGTGPSRRPPPLTAPAGELALPSPSEPD
ncbi:very short patch repair endonuclease [Sphingomonas sp. F9_3S_D5_B_2]